MWEKISTEDIKRLKCGLYAALQLMATLVRPEDVVLFVGPTKAGKSTLINFELGNELVGVPTGKYKITIKQKSPQDGPVIGASSNSETTEPTRWDNARRLPGLVIWDSPGFQDNRGSIPAIINAYYIYGLFKNVQSLKIALVVDFNDIYSDQINQFLTLLHTLENMFHSHMKNCFPSIIIVFTKVPDKLFYREVDVEDICEMLQDKILDNTSIDISPVSREFIQYLIKNQQQIGLFRMARAGKLGDDVDCGVSTAILTANSVQSETLREIVSPSLYDKSQKFLYTARKDLHPLDSFNELFNIIQKAFTEKLNKYNELLKTANTKGSLVNMKDKLLNLVSNMEEMVNTKIIIQDKIHRLQLIDPVIKNNIYSDDLFEDFELMQFIDHLLNVKDSKEFDIYLDSILKKIISDIKVVIVNVQNKLGEISMADYEEKIKNIQSKYNEEMQDMKTKLSEIKIHNHNIARKKGIFSQIGGILDSLFGF